MANSQSNPSFLQIRSYRFLILVKLFLIIFVYHFLKDLKDSLVITSSSAGAEVIPFIKIWVILPFVLLGSYCFGKSYQELGREKTFTLFILVLLGCYALFAFVLYPARDSLALSKTAEWLQFFLPEGLRGFNAMICFWIYAFFYLAAELWAVLILSVLFWGYLNEITSSEEAKTFYPLCALIGNCAGIVAGQTSHFLCRHFSILFSWDRTLQCLVGIVILAGIGILYIHRLLTRYYPFERVSKQNRQNSSENFTQNFFTIFRSKSLFCIAVLVISFGLTTNLVEVIWKETIKQVYPLPQEYNAYVNRLTSLIGLFAVVVALLSRWIFKVFHWRYIAMVTPVVLFLTSIAFFSAYQVSSDFLLPIANIFKMNELYFVMTLGSLYYISAMIAKYTLFDMCKEMAFLSIARDSRMKAKSIIDSVGSRLGKSGSSCLYQFLLLVFGSTSGCVPLIGIFVILIISLSIATTKMLGREIGQERVIL